MSRKNHKQYDTALELLREQQKIILAQKREGISPGDIALWFLAAFLALGLFLAAPKLGRGVTVIFLVAMIGCLVHPIWQLPLVKNANSTSSKTFRYAGFILIAIILVTAFGVYVWPSIPYYRTLSGEEIELFRSALGKPPLGAEEIQFGCPQGSEDVCVVAEQFVPIFQRAGWKVQGNTVQRTSVQKPASGVTIFRRGMGIADPSNPDQGLWTIRSRSFVQITKAFATLDITPSRAADPTMADGVMGIYFGPAPTL